MFKLFCFWTSGYDISIDINWSFGDIPIGNYVLEDLARPAVDCPSIVILMDTSTEMNLPEEKQCDYIVTKVGIHRHKKSKSASG